MIANHRWGLAACIGLYSLLLSLAALPQSTSKEEATKAKLEELRKQIALVQKRLERNRGQRDDLQTQLRATEREISNIDNALITVRAAIQTELKQLDILGVEATALSQQVANQREHLLSELRQLWGLNQGGSARILFGDQSPDRLARNLAFYKRLLHQRSDRIDQFLNLLDEVEANTQATRAAQQRLSDRRANLERDRGRAAVLQRDRIETLAQIESALQTDGARVRQLQQDSERLSELLEELRKTLAELDTPTDYKPFTAAKGEMRYPVVANPSHQFGDIRNRANMRWQGWMLPAREGSDIQAIHHGRVVYSDWLRGQGLLMIIDHGEGYLSLYGHNRSLRKEIGDWVTPGMIIATVGASGGNTAPGVYFEIRHQGKPIDPSQWLKR